MSSISYEECNLRFVPQTLGSLQLISTTVEAASIDRAKAIRARRDAIYRNIYPEHDTDARWVGDLAEICVDEWLEAEHIPREWLAGDKAAGLHDFMVAGWRMDIKAVKRKVVVREDYTAQVTAKHADEPVDGYLFATWHTETNNMWLLGAIGRQRFRQAATYHGAGSKVHENYTVREGHEIYNVPIRELTSPANWLKLVRKRQAGLVEPANVTSPASAPPDMIDPK